MEKNTPKQLAPVNGTPFDYLRWRGDLAFARDGFNEVDNLVLCILSYICLLYTSPSPRDCS